MKLGPVLTYKDVDEAKRLIGKKVVASDFYASICDDDTACDCVHDTLKAVHADKVCPFECITFYDTQFIREILDEAKYEPYDFSDPAVRDSLRGKWFRNKNRDERFVHGFLYPSDYDVWLLNDCYSSKEFLELCVWLDGTPCGRRVDKEMGLPILTRDEEETR